VFCIRRVFDDLLSIDRAAIARVQEILQEQFPAVSSREVKAIPAQLRNPLRHRFRTVLLVAEAREKVLGFALVLHVSDLGFCLLDYLAATRGRTGGGVGAALYQRVREEARALESRCILMECLSDEAMICLDPALIRQNRARMRFYERFGARPVIGTVFETPFEASPDQCPPALICDLLGLPDLSLIEARAMVRAFLERKYGSRCPQGYVDMVLDSFRDDPIRLRAPRYLSPNAAVPAVPRPGPSISLTVNDRHDIHHVHERGYVESPVRIKRILDVLEPSNLFIRLKVGHFPESHILAVHDKGMVRYFKRACACLPEGKSIYPYVFPLRNRTRPPRELPVRAGYYCIDTFTPLNRNAYLAAMRAVDCALTASEDILSGRRLAYALIRPPGHHAGRSVFGGFCYFNSAAVAAQFLSVHGRVAVLDIDYHHGNGTQDIFYERADVFTQSIHGHPRLAYPYFSGFATERGQGPGLGKNQNYPLPEHVDGPTYMKVLSRALARIERFAPTFVVLCLGLDTAKNDPTGSWNLSAGDLTEVGRRIGFLGLPVLAVQEGGYHIPSLGKNALAFFQGLHTGMADRVRVS
jgi:acetoin utilization deacetylase AcuC-like enzyme/GNAT superfamily N-acetyltransferase